MLYALRPLLTVILFTALAATAFAAPESKGEGKKVIDRVDADTLVTMFEALGGGWAPTDYPLPVTARTDS